MRYLAWYLVLSCAVSTGLLGYAAVALWWSERRQRGNALPPESRPLRLLPRAATEAPSA